MKVHVYVDGVWEKSFGFSHDARKSNHHIAGNLGISQADTQALARSQVQGLVLQPGSEVEGSLMLRRTR